MRYLSFCFLWMFLSGVALGQFDTPNTGTGIDVGTGGNTNNVGTGNQTGGGSGGGSNAQSQGIGAGSSMLNAAFGERGTVLQSTGFIGGNANAQQGNFLGQNPALNNSQFNNNPLGNRGQFGNVGGFGAAGRGGFGQQLQRTTRRRIRTRLVLPADFAVEFRTVPPVKLQDSLSKQFEGIDASQAKSQMALGASRVFADADIRVTASGRTVTLRGQVGSDRERKLAERIAKFEPGVDRVVNQLTVAESRR